MFGKRFELFKLFGFAIRIDLSWFLVAILVAWFLATEVFPPQYKELAPRVYWTMGILGALGLFISVVLHELGHALVARRFGLEMKGITLFLFGGVAEMSGEPPSAKAEFWVAVAGPAVSVAIGLACFGVGRLAGAGWPVPVQGVVAYLAFINLILVAFNVIPAFPLDGGRVLRSILWQWKSDLRWATRISARIGSGFGVLLILYGVSVVIASNNLLAGMWWFLIGLFLRGAAQMSYQQLLLRQILEGEPVRRFMHDSPVTVPRAISIRELVDDYVYRYHFKLFPVVDGDRLLGCVTTRRIKELPHDEWDRQTVGAIASRCDESNTITPEDDAMKALARMNAGGASRLMVVDGDRLVGILTLKDLLGFFSLKVDLEEREGRAA
jgi:Zn-dependent protease/CBS domain-containing protein